MDQQELWAPSQVLGLDVRVDGSLYVVVVSGELDLAGALVLESALERLLRADHTVLTVDLAAVTFVDCAGLRVLIAATERCASAGGRLTVVGAALSARRVIRVLDLDAVLHLA